MMRLPYKPKHLTIFTGALAGGKTELASNFSFSIAQETGQNVYLIDLDNVKPYFKARNLKADYHSAGIKLIAPPEEYLYSDMPLLPPQARNLLANPDIYAIADVGGDESGARALSGYRDEISARDYDFLFVINKNRPYPKDVKAAIEMIGNIEEVSGLKISGLINNTHLLQETTADIIAEGAQFVRAVSQESGIPFLFTAHSKGIKYSELENLYEIELYYSDISSFLTAKD